MLLVVDQQNVGALRCQTEPSSHHDLPRSYLHSSGLSIPSLKMAFKLVEIDPENDFVAISRCMFESHETPEQPFFQAFFPTHGAGDQAREQAIAEGATRLHSWHTGDPTSYWQKVVDTSTGRIAGAVLWNICHEDPFAGEDQLEVTWFPHDQSREFVEQFLEIYEKPRAQVGRRPQVCRL